MMTVQPTCRYCHRPMSTDGTRVTGYGTTVEAVCAWQYLCKRCHSEQAFETDGKCLDYSFMVGQYHLCFYPKDPSFTITHYPEGRLRSGTLVLRLKVCPTHLTPQNMNEDRIKCLITFS